MRGKVEVEFINVYRHTHQWTDGQWADICALACLADDTLALVDMTRRDQGPPWFQDWFGHLGGGGADFTLFVRVEPR